MKTSQILLCVFLSLFLTSCGIKRPLELPDKEKHNYKKDDTQTTPSDDDDTMQDLYVTPTTKQKPPQNTQ